MTDIKHIFPLIYSLTPRAENLCHMRVTHRAFCAGIFCSKWNDRFDSILVDRHPAPSTPLSLPPWLQPARNFSQFAAICKNRRRLFLEMLRLPKNASLVMMHWCVKCAMLDLWDSGVWPHQAQHTYMHECDNVNPHFPYSNKAQVGRKLHDTAMASACNSDSKKSDSKKSDRILPGIARRFTARKLWARRKRCSPRGHEEAGQPRFI